MSSRRGWVRTVRNQKQFAFIEARRAAPRPLVRL